MNDNEQQAVVIYHEMTPPPTTCPVCQSEWKNYAVLLRPMALYQDFDKVGCVYHFIEWMGYLRSQGFLPPVEQQFEQATSTNS